MAGISEAKIKAIEAAWSDLLERIAGGQLIKDARAVHGFSDNDILAYHKTFPASRLEWDGAKLASAASFMDEALTVARDPFIDLGKDSDGKAVIVRRDASHARTYIDTLKWAARIRNPQAYSDKTQIDMNVRTVDLTAIIRDANARLIASQQGRLIEHEVDNNSATSDSTRTRESVALPLARSALL